MNLGYINLRPVFENAFPPWLFPLENSSTSEPISLELNIGFGFIKETIIVLVWK
jgi:hypothetical protein